MWRFRVAILVVLVYQDISLMKGVRLASQREVQGNVQMVQDAIIMLTAKKRPLETTVVFVRLAGLEMDKYVVGIPI